MAIPIVYNVRNVMLRPWTTLATGWGIAMVVLILVGAFALASGFQAALVESGSPANAIVLRVGADSEISSGVGRDAASILKALPDIAPGPDGRPLVSADMVVLTNLPRIGQSGTSNVTIRGIDPTSLTLRDQVKIVAGRMFTPGTGEVIVGQRISPRFAGLRVGDHVTFGQQSFSVVGLFGANGSAFESEIWGDNAVLMPAFDRTDAFQTVTFRMRDPSRFAELNRRLEGDPRLGVQVKTEREFYSEQSQLLANMIRVA